MSSVIPGVPDWDADESVWNMSREYRRDYVQMKYEVAGDFQPKRICEIGVYSGISAACFLAVSPKAMYMGIDDKSSERDRGISVVDSTWDRLLALGYDVAILEGDSQRMTILPNPPYDFIHVDGDHSIASTVHDVFLAWKSLDSGGCLLVDNAHDTNVCRGVFIALNEKGERLLDWRYDPRSVGQIIVRKP